MADYHWKEAEQRDWRLPIWKSSALESTPDSHYESLTSSELRDKHKRLAKKHGLRKEYSSILLFCPKNSILFWDDAEHPYSVIEEHLQEILPADFVAFFD